MAKDYNFKKTYTSIRRCYAKTIEDRLPTIDNFQEERSDTGEDVYSKSLRLRTIAVNELRKARDEGSRLNIKRVWGYISESIRILPVEATISSIGSQGFLSIPLFKYDDERDNFEFIRLHIWDKILDRHVNQAIREQFSIHTHSFHAESWILCGQIINDRFIVEETSNHTPYSLFTIGYNSTLNEVNQHTSVANRTEQYVNPIQVSHEVYMQNGNYSVRAGEYHKSGSNEKDGISATLFSFTADAKFQGPSFVLGPSNIPFSEINRKELIDPLNLISKIDNQIGPDE